KPWLWGKNIGHLWRTTGDITNCFDCVVDHGSWKSWGIMYILDMQEGLRTYTGPGHWNDPDMMEVGNGMSLNEDRAHFSMWCMLAAPLIAGNDIRKLTDETKNILTNKEVIAVDQDSLGIQGFKYSSEDSVEVWFKPLQNNEWAACFLNRSLKIKQIAFDWNKENVIDTVSGRKINSQSNLYKIRDLWTKKEMGTTEKILNAEVPGHDVLMIKLYKKN
ncbi:MAG: alpha-galactosidase, partial [Ignavibacteria bacterium]